MDAFNVFINFCILICFCEVPFIFLDRLVDAVKFRIKIDGFKKHK